MRTKINIGILLSVFLLSSCSNILYTSLDVLRPAQVTFSPSANRLLIVDRSVTQPADYGHYIQFFDKNAVSIAVSTDSLAFFNLEALAEGLVAKDFFKTITLHNSNISDNELFFTIQTMPFDTINALCNRYDSDVILALDRIRVIDEIQEFYSYDDLKFYMTHKARYETRMSIYYPETTAYESAIFRDTLYWSASATQPTKAYYELPDRSDALIDGAIYAGSKTAERLIPSWAVVDRYLIEHSNKSLKQGLDSMTFRNFEAAISIWKQTIASSKSNTRKAIAAHNIAINYEILGNVDLALEFSDKAVDYIRSASFVNTKVFDSIELYNLTIARRKVEVDLLDKQLGN